ncbi:hypothetical protein [Kribbella yunnanensis]|uniref:hypothetical protein n=1 Tax=Kribbella yunnanensis TaxID=190194 RepID=UPI0031D6E812
MRDFADRLGVQHRTVSKWEAKGANRTPQGHMQAILDTALAQADDDARTRFELALQARNVADNAPALVNPAAGSQVDTAPQIATPDQFDRAADPTMLWLPTSTARDVRDFAIRDLMLDRRRVLSGGLAALAVGSRLTEPIDGWAAGIPMYFSANKAGTVTEEEVHHIELTGRALRGWNSRFRMGIRRKAVLGQLAEVAELIELGQPAELERRLFRVSAELSKVAASMSWDAGLNAEAQHYYLLSLRASHAAHDQLFGINVLAAMARQMVYLNRGTDALDIVRAAADSAARTTPRVYAMLRVREAWAHARLGRSEAFRRVTGKAEELLSSESSNTEDPYWISGFDRAELSGTTGGRYLELATITGKPQAFADADTYISEALRLRDGGNLRSRALDTINLARARLGTQEPVEAARIALDAMSIARRTNSGHVDRKLRRFSEESARYSKNPNVRQARQELGDYLRKLPQKESQKAR